MNDFPVHIDGHNDVDNQANHVGADLDCLVDIDGCTDLGSLFRRSFVR